MKIIDLDRNLSDSLLRGTQSCSHVTGYTHNFYRYPARFSPEFVRAVITTFTKHGDLVLDPFLGGGTTAVEARALGRRVIGVDINSLATFVSKAKTSLLSKYDINEISKWSNTAIKNMTLNNPINIDEDWLDYFKNIDCKHTWPIRKAIQLTLGSLENLLTYKQKRFARCTLLKTAQWALDSRKKIPSVSEFRYKFLSETEIMLDAIRDYATIVHEADKTWDAKGLNRLKILNRSTADIDREASLLNYPKPKLILTSPPYPGVHVLYHRWQVNGRRETPAPYWIANKLDGSGASYYTFGDRKEEQLTNYYTNTYNTFKSLTKMSGEYTIFVQMIAFSEPSWQLPLYLDTLHEAGLQEYKVLSIANNEDGRFWRNVPNRKWHAYMKGQTPSSKEVVLFHKLK